MIRILTALTGLFIMVATPASALDLYSMPQAEIQQKLDDKLPLTTKPVEIKPTPFTVTGTLLEGATLHLHANGTVTMEGAFEIRSRKGNPLYRARFEATTNLLLKDDGIYIDRTSLDDFEGAVIAAKSENRLKNIFAAGSKMVLNVLNKPGFTRDLLALILLKEMEEKPIIRFNGGKPWHAAVKQALASGVLNAESIVITEDLLTIRTP